MSLSKPLSTELDDYNEDAVLASGDKVYQNVTTAANIRDVCQKTDMMSLRDPIPLSETQDVHMTPVSPSHNRQNTPPRTLHDTSSDTPPLNVTSHSKQKNATIPPPPKDSLHNKNRSSRASSTDSSSSASSHSSKHRRSRSMHVPRDSHKRKHHTPHTHSKHRKHSEHSTPRHSRSRTRSKTPPTVPP
ncbi:cyclin-L1-like [Montipora capricornis]|uniref:cyclin-L1-like n=1 Tax=Montipora capricornis TaxID=246305 RepID=UPI0035F21784